MIKVAANMKEFNITTDSGSVLCRVHATDERRALLIFLMKYPEIKDVELRRGSFHGKWMLVNCNKRDDRLFAKEVTSSNCVISDELKQEILDRTT